VNCHWTLATPFLKRREKPGTLDTDCSADATVDSLAHVMGKAIGLPRPAPDLSRSGIYSVSEAAALIGESQQKIRAWVDGWPRSGVPALVDNDLGWVDDRLAFSFANLMELRFVSVFAKVVKIREIRAVMDEARRETRRAHPFATNIVFRTDGKKIIVEIAHRNNVTQLYDLKSRNFEIGGVMYRTLKQDVVYDPKGDAAAWFPRRGLAPNVMVHPRLAFGRPVLQEDGIPTEAIADAIKAEGGSVDKVAALFEISRRRVQEAVAFENHLQRAA
jgi:uncharacterized protein (DUF433 family)